MINDKEKEDESQQKDLTSRKKNKHLKNKCVVYIKIMFHSQLEEKR